MTKPQIKSASQLRDAMTLGKKWELGETYIVTGVAFQESKHGSVALFTVDEDNEEGIKKVFSGGVAIVDFASKLTDDMFPFEATLDVKTAESGAEYQVLV